MAIAHSRRVTEPRIEMVKAAKPYHRIGRCALANGDLCRVIDVLKLLIAGQAVSIWIGSSAAMSGEWDKVHLEGKYTMRD